MAHGPTTWNLSLATTSDEQWMVDKEMHKNMSPSDSVAHRGNIVHGRMQPGSMLPRTYLELASSASHIYPHPCNTAVRAYIKCRNASQNNAATKSNPHKGACPTCLRLTTAALSPAVLQQCTLNTGVSHDWSSQSRRLERLATSDYGATHKETCSVHQDSQQ